MFLDIDLQSPKPVYQQLIDQVKLAWATGRLKPGDKLPSLRDLSVELRVNRNTIARAYDELQREGVLTNRQGQGCYVSDRGSSLAAAPKREELVARTDELLAQARLYGYSREAVEKLLEDRIRIVYRNEALESTRRNSK